MNLKSLKILVSLDPFIKVQFRKQNGKLRITRRSYWSGSDQFSQQFRRHLKSFQGHKTFSQFSAPGPTVIIEPVDWEGQSSQTQAISVLLPPFQSCPQYRSFLWKS